jgi:hypothetical protein
MAREMLRVGRSRGMLRADSALEKGCEVTEECCELTKTCCELAEKCCELAEKCCELTDLFLEECCELAGREMLRASWQRNIDAAT